MCYALRDQVVFSSVFMRALPCLSTALTYNDLMIVTVIPFPVFLFHGFLMVMRYVHHIFHNLLMLPCPGPIPFSDLFNQVLDLCLSHSQYVSFLSRYGMFDILLSIVMYGVVSLLIVVLYKNV